MNNENTANNKNTKTNITDYSKNNNNKYSNPYNSSYDRSLQQSPKIRTGKYRPQSSRLRPFSLIDIDDRKTLTKAPYIPVQNKRISEEEFKKLFNGKKPIAGSNNDKKELIHNFLEKDDKNIKNNINNKENDNMEKNKIKSNNNLTIETKTSLDLNKIRNKKEIKKDNDNLKKLKKEIEGNKNKNNKINRPLSAQLRTKKDRWLPNGYPYYEYCVNNPKYFKEDLKKNPFINREHIYDIKEITQKSNESDIFFLGPQSEKETKLLVIGNYEKSKNYDAKLGSDIFNLKKDFTNLMKSSETYLFKNNNYPISSESRSFWVPKSNIPTYINHPSVEYNILNPKAKCNTKTKNQIYNECKQKKNDETKNIVNYMNPIFRQKNISNFYDITKGGMNRNFAYEKIYHDNPRSYYRKNNICTLQYDLYKNYRGISERPFMTQVNKKIQF